MGELIAILSAFAFGAGNVLIKKGSTPSGRYNGAVVSVVLTLALSGLFFVGFGLYHGWPALNAQGMYWFILAGFLTAYVGRVFLFLSIQHIGSVRAATIKQLSPFFAVIISVIFLQERLTVSLLVGMLLIFLGFALLVAHSNRNAPKTDAKPSVKQMLSSIAALGYVYGPISALAYACGMVVRKKGLLEVPDPYFGTMIGAGIGLLIFAVLALFQKDYRDAVVSTFTRFEKWLFFAGLLISFGQILYFVALNYIEVSRVALIVSIETILTMFFSAWVFKTRENISKEVMIAALVSMLGAGIIAYFK